MWIRYLFRSNWSPGKSSKPTPDYTDFSPSKSLCIYANSNYIIIVFSLVQCLFSHSITYYAWTILKNVGWLEMFRKQSTSMLVKLTSLLKHESIPSFQVASKIWRQLRLYLPNFPFLQAKHLYLFQLFLQCPGSQIPYHLSCSLLNKLVCRYTTCNSQNWKQSSR